MKIVPILFSFFFFNDTATTEIYTLSLHDALPICPHRAIHIQHDRLGIQFCSLHWRSLSKRSEEHTSELQSRLHLVCRLLLEKKKKAQWACNHCNDASLRLPRARRSAST